MQLGTRAWIPPQPPFFVIQLFQKTIFGLESIFSFTFSTFLKDKLTGYTGLQSYHAFSPPFRPKMFWGYIDQKLKNGLYRYLSSWKFKANIWIFQIAFSQWIAPLTKNRFQVFFRAGLHLHVRKISTFSVKQFKFFDKISYILDN